MKKQLVRLLGTTTTGSEAKLDAADPEFPVHSGAFTTNTSGQYLKTRQPRSEAPVKTPAVRAGRPFESTFLGQILASEAAFAGRHQTQLSLVALELDPVCSDGPGDLQFEHWLGIQVRQEDIIVRNDRGGFVLLLRATGLDGARSMATRVCRRAATELAGLWGAQPVRLRAGCASLEACGHDPHALVALAERRLRLAQETESLSVVGGSPLCLVPGPSTEDGDPSPPLEEVIRHTARLIERLPHQLQVVLALRHQLECSFQEIAAYLDVSEAEASELYGRALAALGT